MAPIPRSYTNAFFPDNVPLDIELKDAPNVSLRELENGCKNKITFWRHLVMALRLRKGNGWQRMSEYESLTQGEAVEGEVFEKHFAQKKRPQWWKRGRNVCFLVVVIILCIFGIIHVVNVSLSHVPILSGDDLQQFLSSWDKRGHPKDDIDSLMSITRNVPPLACHSHNDYHQRVPLYDALRTGCTSVEADIWRFPDTKHEDSLYVGHSARELSHERTLRTLYLDPLVELLDRKNNGTALDGAPRQGVFDKDPSRTLVLLIDFKTDWPTVFDSLLKQLAPLKDKKYLTYFDGHTVIPGPITVVGTGNAPFDMTINKTTRNIFFDAPLGDMYEDPYAPHPTRTHPSTSTQTPTSHPQSHGHDTRGQGRVGVTKDTQFDPINSYFASVSFHKSIGYPEFRGGLSQHQRRLVSGQIKGAHRRGLKVRYWDTPNDGTRDKLWAFLVDEGADYLNTDDLKAVAKGRWTKYSKQYKKHGWV